MKRVAVFLDEPEHAKLLAIARSQRSHGLRCGVSEVARVILCDALRDAVVAAP